SAQTKDRLDRRDLLLGWEAVGRLDTSTGHCTAALIARDVALTAAHCVIDQDPNRMLFRAGYRDGVSIAERRVTEVVMAEGYAEARAAGDNVQEIARDVAVLRLSSAIFEPGAEPYAIVPTPRRAPPLTLASYGRGRIEALTLERGCALEKRYQGGIVGLNCDVTFGSSGAPVFLQTGGRPQIFSLISAMVPGETSPGGTLGVELAHIVPGLVTELHNRRALTPVATEAKRIGVGVRSTGGARFVRP
ncbi:MAG: trypsin-like peptidase domain-containing protein, partial [Pseudomonadota bacterium]